MQKNNFFCDVCKINVQSAAEYALHEFSKKHCSNLMKIAKNKKASKKEKAAASEEPPPGEESPPTQEPQPAEEPPPAVEPLQPSAVPAPAPPPAPEGITKYGYFVPGKIYETGADAKQYNTDYDPYEQIFAENPNKEASQVPLVRPAEDSEEESADLKWKKRKVQTCQICNVTFATVPDYETHMKSSQHVQRLKSSGMGVSAHFVKASTDLHTVESEEKQEELKIRTVKKGVNSSGIFPLLYCDVCELLLNSEQQYNAHVIGKAHIDNVQRKAELKAKRLLMDNPTPEQLYCFSCKLGLNNLYQYNEHKYGRKHQVKCRKLMKMGITIPPEERVAALGIPEMDPNMKVIYPELYEKFLLEKGKNANSPLGKAQDDPPSTNADSAEKSSDEKSDNLSSSEDQSENNKEQETGSEKDNQPAKECVTKTTSKEESNAKDKFFAGRPKFVIIGTDEPFKCGICALEFVEQRDFNLHLTTEDHANRIVEAKEKGMKDEEILNGLFYDKSVVRPDRSGRYTCSACSITTGNGEEYAYHRTTLVHQQFEIDYKRKTNLEVRYAVKMGEDGKYTCKTCGEICDNRLDYNCHLPGPKHRQGMRTERSRKIRKVSLLRRVKQKYIISGFKRKDFACWRRKCEENPGFRTMTLGTVMDGSEGYAGTDPDCEGLESEMEDSPGAGLFSQGTKRKNADQGNFMKGTKRTKPNRQEFYPKPLMSRLFLPNPPLHPPPLRPPLHPALHAALRPPLHPPLHPALRPPPLPPPIPPPHPPLHPALRHSHPMFHRNWTPFPQYPLRPMPYHQRPIFPMNRFQRPPNFHPMWPRYPRPCYN